jgi:hypothetical protein
VEGNNSFGEPVYSFVYMTVAAFREMKKAMDEGQPVMPGYYGTVLAAGSGDPTPDVIAELQTKYNYQKIERPAPKIPPMPKFNMLGDDEDWD